jgi:Family of unknown function (DUF6236)
MEDLMTHIDSSSSSVGLPRFGLYFPYIHFRDDNWAKLAALYWPKMARIVPAKYPTRDSDTVKALNDSLNWTIDLQPDQARELVMPAFEDFLADPSIQRILDASTQGLLDISQQLAYLDPRVNNWRPARDSRISLMGSEANMAPGWGAGPDPASVWGFSVNGQLAGVYSTELAPYLRERLMRIGLAQLAWVDHSHTTLVGVEQRSVTDGEWLIMHRDLAWIYKCLLSETLASHNRLALTTDQVDAHAAASGLSARQLMFGGVAGETLAGDLVTTFGLMAIQTAVPRDPASVSVDQIIAIREKYGEQFDSWRDYIDQVGTDLAEQLAAVESPEVLHRYLEEAARRYAEAPVDRLRRGLRSVGVDTVNAALNTKFETPAAVAATGLATGNPLAVAAGAAVGIAELRRNAMGRARTQLASPSSYLLNVEESLTPRSWIERVRAAMRVAAGLRG